MLVKPQMCAKTVPQAHLCRQREPLFALCARPVSTTRTQVATMQKASVAIVIPARPHPPDVQYVVEIQIQRAMMMVG